MKYLLLILAASTGCMSRVNTRFTPEGTPYARESTRTFLVKTEASKIKEEIVETKGGDYTRKVSVGSLSASSELDKVIEVLKAAKELKP